MQKPENPVTELGTMIWPLPESWRASVVDSIRKHARMRAKFKQEKKKKSGSRTPNRDADPVYDFQHHTLREKYYQIIGHHYVLDLCRAAFAEEEGIENQLDSFIKKLGINSTQRERWISEKTFIEADNFFAYSLLIAATRVSDLPLSENAGIVEKSVVSTLHYLAKTYDHPVPLRLDPQTLLFVIALMNEMKASSDSVFNPHDKKRKADSESGLTMLSHSFLPVREDESNTDQNTRRIRLEQTIRRTLTNWGLAYGLYVYGRRDNWREGGLK